MGLSIEEVFPRLDQWGIPVVERRHIRWREKAILLAALANRKGTYISQAKKLIDCRKQHHKNGRKSP